MPDLDLPVPGVTGSPEWAVKLNAALEEISDAVDAIEPGPAISNSDSIPQGTTNLYMTSAERTKLSGVASGATSNATDAQLRDRSTHTGSQAISTVTGLQTALDGKAAITHTHSIANVTGLQTALDNLASGTGSTPVLVLNAADTIPVGTAPNTIIVRKA